MLVFKKNIFIRIKQIGGKIATKKWHCSGVFRFNISDISDPGGLPNPLSIRIKNYLLYIEMALKTQRGCLNRQPLH